MRMDEHERRSWRSGAPWKVIVVAALAVAPSLGAQQSLAATPAERARADSALAAMRQATAEDHKQMLGLLGITALRPGPSGNESAPNHANYDSTLANPFTSLPDVLRMKDGRRVTNARMWQQRRREIIDGFEREVYGRVPARVPKVAWTVTATDTGRVGGRRVIAKQLVGHADNSGDTAIVVDIPLTVVVPEDAKAPVPLMIMFRPGTLESALGRPPLPGARPQGFVPPPPAPGSDAPATEQLIVDRSGIRLPESDERAGRQRRWSHAGDHRAGESRAAAKAGRLGCAARVGVGRVARARLSGDRQGRRCEEGRHRRKSRGTARRRW